MFSKVKLCFVVGLAAAFALGCNTTVSGGGDGGSGGSGGSATGGSGGAGGASGAVCGGIAGTVCAANEYCDYPDDSCGAFDTQGVCRLRPDACPENYAPTCGCDGMIHSNECFAYGEGADLSNMGGCTAPTPDLFGCGYGFCDKATQYCVKTNSDVGGTPDSYTCANLPTACAGTASCACIGDPCGAPIAAMCEATADGGFRVTCPGG